MKSSTRSEQAVYIVDAARTPFLPVTGRRGPFSAADLAIAAARPLLLRQPFDSEAVDEVIVGNVLADHGGELAHEIAARLGCDDDVSAYTVTRGIASGLQALDAGAQSIKAGTADLVLVGGTEAMSRSPLRLNSGLADYLRLLRATPRIADRLRHAFDLSWRDLFPLAEPSTPEHLNPVNLARAEQAAYRFKLSRQRMNAFAAQSRQRASAAQAGGPLSEVRPLYGRDGRLIEYDPLTTDSADDNSITTGAVTPSNCAMPADGAAWLLLASEKGMAQYELAARARLVSVQWASAGEEYATLGALQALSSLLKRHRRASTDIDYYELEETSAAAVLASLEAAREPDYCRRQLSRRTPLEGLDLARINVDGGALGLGLPLGASNLRSVQHLVETLHAREASRGIVATATVTGHGGAALLEAVRT